MKKTGKALIVYYNATQAKLRSSSQQYLDAFVRHLPARTIALNLAYGVPFWLEKIQFDLIVFHETLMTKRALPARFRNIQRLARRLSPLAPVRVAIVQDEFSHTRSLVDFIVDNEVTHVFSAAGPTEWPKIYSGVDFAKVSFHQALTGYLDPAIAELCANIETDRVIDIGYRANFDKRFNLGRFGLLKGLIAEKSLAAGKALGLKMDISTLTKDTIFGLEWYHFLARCKYTIGCESGASLLDETGTIYEAVDRYKMKSPDAQFDEVEAACFPGKDYNLRLFALGPRHLEACLTKTCQILVAGDYNGVLKAGIHYLPVKADLSDLSEVLGSLNEETRTRIVEAAYQDLVASGTFTYEAFVREFLTTTEPRWTPISTRESVYLGIGELRDSLTIKTTFVLGSLSQWLQRNIPKQWIHMIEKVVYQR